MAFTGHSNGQWFPGSVVFSWVFLCPLPQLSYIIWAPPVIEYLSQGQSYTRGQDDMESKERKTKAMGHQQTNLLVRADCPWKVLQKERFKTMLRKEVPVLFFWQTVHWLRCMQGKHDSIKSIKTLHRIFSEPNGKRKTAEGRTSHILTVVPIHNSLRWYI